MGEPADAAAGSSGGGAGEADDGLTPPMHRARARLFKRQIDVDPELVSKVEYNLLTILAVRACWQPLWLGVLLGRLAGRLWDGDVLTWTACSARQQA